jgi:hypothetical protein
MRDTHRHVYPDLDVDKTLLEKMLAGEKIDGVSEALQKCYGAWSVRGSSKFCGV